MKGTYIFIIVLLVGLQACAQKKESFDQVSYSPPKGWAIDRKEQTVTFSKEEGNQFCVISLGKSIDATADAQQNFDNSWQIIAQTNLGAGTVQMQPGSTDKGWETKIGSAPFNKEGLKGSAILINSSKNNRQVNILIIANTNEYQKEMEAFLESIDLKEIVTTNNNTSTTAQSSNKSTNKPELWVNWRASQKNMLSPKTSSNIKQVIDFYAIYPNGDYFPEVPWQGLTNFNKSYNTQSWGKFTMQGTKGKFKSKYQDIEVIKVSQTKMEQTGFYNYGFYKCLPVDGLRIDGAYNVVSENWGKDPQLDYLNGPGCQFVIYFKKDGTFDDKGIFYTGPMPSSGNCSGGKGTYSIDNYTIIFKYNDGRVVYRLFTLPGTRNPASYDEAIYLGETAYYKKR
ncbi:MAG: hypothetical protein WC623_21235 [Pedobacter sp.]|uniref:hypothetical protein n=1 Tax=Pedobacter sp. TaxID=1411316 RepID=UPI0035696909